MSLVAKIVFFEGLNAAAGELFPRLYKDGDQG